MKLIGKEQCRLWIVVVAGNDPDGDVAALTRGAQSLVDIDRLVRSTNATIVADVKKHPEKLGVLGYVLDAKLLFLPITTALAILRDFADNDLRAAMSAVQMQTAGDGGGTALIGSSELGFAFNNQSLGTRKRGKPGDNTRAAFGKVSNIAAKRDGLLNAALGRALVDAKLIPSYKTERDLGKGMPRKTDIFCEIPDRPVRLEIMWRKKTGRAEIANYALTKLYNYGRAIGFLEGAAAAEPDPEDNSGEDDGRAEQPS